MNLYKAIQPETTLSDIDKVIPYPNDERWKTFIDGLRMAGLE